MEAKLIVVSGTTKAAEITLRLPAVIGRGRDATLMLPHPLISRRHCEVFESNGYLVVRDMGSLNGTYINSKRITEAVLPPGGKLTLGSVTFQAEYVAGSVDERPAAVPDREGALPPATSTTEIPVLPQPAAGGAQAGAGQRQDFEDFEIVEVVEEPKPKQARKKTPAAKEPVPEQATIPNPPPAQPGPSKARPALDDDLADFLSDFQ
jgi:pSer/pThr/pTyr-binding forkhead associated (FHA) protein